MKELQKMMGWEILQEYKKGRRDFSNALISMAEFAGADMRGIILRNCKLENVTFRGANLTSADFTDSEIIFAGFNDADLTRAKFNRCIIKWATFDSTIFNDTEMKNSDINWAAFFNVNIGCIDFSNSSQYKVFTDLSQVTEPLLAEAINEFSTFLNKVDFEKSLRMRVIANRVLKNYDMAEQTIPKIGTDKKDGYDNIASIYSKMLDDIIEESISAYKQTHPYTQKSAYLKQEEKRKGKYGAK